MEVTSPTTPKTQPPAQPKSQAGSVLSSDFETFLKMLTAQARYQDPLEPIDSTEYAAQLAQFSMVEQQVKSNDLLSALSSQLGAGSIGQVAGWIGMEARTTAPVQFSGKPITVTPKPTANADQAMLIVKDSKGAEVQRARIPATSDPVIWAGTSTDGSPFPQGLYTFEVESMAKGKVLATDPAQSYGRLTEARVENGKTVLIFEGGSTVDASTISGLREPI